MKSVTIAVIFAGLVTYGNTYSPPASDVPDNPTYASIATQDPPLFTDPDDDEDQDRVSYSRKRKR